MKDAFRRISKCQICGNLEYCGEFRFLDGWARCRDCYKKAYRETYGKEYKWPDLDGPRPTLQEYLLQEEGGAENG